MKVQDYFGHMITVSLLGFAGIQHSSTMAYAAVCALFGVIVKESVAAYLTAKVPVVQPGIPEEVRRTIHDINARVATLEYGVKQRGF